MRLACVGAWNARRPVAISCRMLPSAKHPSRESSRPLCSTSSAGAGAYVRLRRSQAAAAAHPTIAQSFQGRMISLPSRPVAQ